MEREKNGSLGWLEKGTGRWSLPRSEGSERVHSQSCFVIYGAVIILSFFI